MLEFGIVVVKGFELEMEDGIFRRRGESFFSIVFFFRVRVGYSSLFLWKFRFFDGFLNSRK